MNFKLYVMNILIALDSLGATLLGDSPDDTISGRCAEGRARGSYCYTVAATIIDYVALHVFSQYDHCEKAGIEDLTGRHDEALP